MNVLLVAALVSLADVALGEDVTYGAGVDNCKCLTSFPQDFIASYFSADGVLEFETPDHADSSRSRMQELPSNYGLGCHDWDVSIPTLCVDPETNQPFTGRDLKTWCQESFCFVDPENCDDTDHWPSGFFHGSGLHYSYKTCGSENHFAKSYKALQMEAEELMETIINATKTVDKAVTEVWTHLVTGTAYSDYEHHCARADYVHQRSCGLKQKSYRNNLNYNLFFPDTNLIIFSCAT